MKDKVEKLEALRARERFGYAGHIALDVGEQQSIWKLRKAGLGLLLGTRGDAKPIAFIEDTAVDPKHMPAFVPRFRDIMAKHGAEGAYYGHCSVGCLHIRPLINLKTERGLEQVQAMAGEIFDMVLEFEGAISSEHGDGRARSPFLERVFGPVVFGAFRELKRAFDPKNLLNPGNIVASPGITEHMRYGAETRPGSRRPAWTSPSRGASPPPSRCAMAWACAGRTSRAPCARPTWRPGTRSTRRGAVPTRCARCCRAGCPARTSPASGSSR